MEVYRTTDNQFPIEVTFNNSQQTLTIEAARELVLKLNAMLLSINEAEHPFWMVYLEGGNNPRFVHDQRISAVTEARRLASQNGKPAHVLEKIGTIIPAQVEWQGVPLSIGEICNELPFE